MSDQQRVSSSIDIAAPPEKVWAMISDLTRMGEWSPENVGGKWKGGATSATVGAKFKGNNVNGKKKWSIGTVTVNEATPPSKLNFSLGVGPIKGATWEYELKPTDAGCTVTETWIDTRNPMLRPDFVGKLVTGVPDRVAFTKVNIETSLANLKKSAES